MEIGQIPRLIYQVTSAWIANNERVVGAPAQPRPIDSLGASAQPRLPVEDAAREIARGITDYIVSNRLTLPEGYQTFRTELISETALSLLSVSEMELIEKLVESLSGKALIGPAATATTEMSAPPVTQANAGLMAVNANETLEQVLERISQTLASGSALPEATKEQPGVGRAQSMETPVGQAPIGSEQRLAMSWTPRNSVTPGNSVALAAEEGFISIPRVMPARGLLGRPVDSNSPLAVVNSLTNGPEMVRATQLYEHGQRSTSGMLRSSLLVMPVITSAPRQSGVGIPPALSSQSSQSPDLLRVDLKELLGGKPAELHIRYDEALIVSKVAVLLEQMNGLVRVCQEQDRGVSYSRQKPSPDLNRTLRQVLAAALGIVIDGNKTFSTPASVGVLAGRDGLLTLDPTILRGALESRRDEAAAVLKSLANSFYDNISLFVDPRILARFSEIIGNGGADKADRTRKEKERRWKKDKDLLEKRFLELGLILEESGKLREWFMDAVQVFGRAIPDSDSDSEASWKEASPWEASCKDPEPSDEVVKRSLPAVGLPWDQEEFLAAGPPEKLKENPVTLFIACTTRALLEEDAGTAIKILLKRKVLSDKLLAERPDLEPKVAMVCLANEELILGRLEAERTKLFKNLDELSRTMVAARGYRSQFPFPPPMAAFIASEG
jgi:hypothetical protein